jgi:pimeloyl-ACP methyl ester carboxylesterase
LTAVDLRRRTLIATVTGVLLATSACASSGSGGLEQALVPTTTTTAATTTTTGSVTPSKPLAWVPCRGATGPIGYQCAVLQVPLDYKNPAARTIGIALDRKPATGTKIGSLLANPGGPGVSGVDGLTYEVSLLSKNVLDHFDIIGFDPRGVARSAPIHCVDGPALDRYLHLDPAPTTDAGFQALVDAAKSLDLGCQANSGDVLPFVSTENAARDMDQIRQAVGDDKLTYLGFSYGTFLGATYAELFPSNVRAMTLDGALDPAADPIKANIDQSAAFDKELNAFFADCASHLTCAWHPGGDLHAAFDALFARIRVQPLPGRGVRKVGPDEALFGVLAPLYDKVSWPDLALALELAGHSDGSLLLALFDSYTQRRPDGTYANQQEANIAVSCLDDPLPRDPAVLRQRAPAAAQAAPEFGLANLYSQLTCAFWPVPPTGHPHTIRAAGAPPIVVVGSTGDPATPYPQAQALAGELEHGVLITRVGDGHTGYRSSACVRQLVDSYLVDLSVPTNGTTCSSP